MTCPSYVHVEMWTLLVYLLTVLGQRVTTGYDQPLLQETSELEEYCQLEKFQAECPDNSVVVITQAKYGRMHTGKCMREWYNSPDCQTDVLDMLDRLCSGRQRCEFDLATLYVRHPCPLDLQSFLEAGYYCQRVIQSQSQHCISDHGLSLPPSGFLSSHITMETDRGSEACPWRIEVPAGQKINVTLVNFAREPEGGAVSGKSSPNPCYQYATFTEASNEETRRECEGGRRLSHVYTSQTNVLDISVLAQQHSDVYFLLHYEAVGCNNPHLDPGHWLKQRTDSIAVVHCNSTGETWNLTCLDKKWKNKLGNCTTVGLAWKSGDIFEKDFPYSILIVVAIGVALGVFLGGILLVCASKYFKRRREGNLQQGQFQQGLYGVEHGKVMSSQFDDVSGGTPRTLQHYHRATRPEDPAVPHEKECKCPFTYGPPPGYHPGSHGTSHMYESPQFDRKDSR